MPLQEEIDAKGAEIKTDSYAMALGELASIYQDAEIDIHPEFQRFYRWSPTQKSRLIESLLLNIPIPPIFVAQREDGVWDVIDGLQRLSTIFEFMGILRDKDHNKLEPLSLQATKYLPSLQDKVWDREGDANSFTQAQRLFVKRYRIDIIIILATSSPSSKYEMFQRLNTGGSELSDQEIRNCVLISIDPDAYRWIEHLSEAVDLPGNLSLTERLQSEQYHLELILRFILLHKTEDGQLNEIKDIGEYITDNMTEMALQGALIDQDASNIFRRTFTLISNSIGALAFQKYDAEEEKFKGSFLISSFEAVTLGVAHNIEEWERDGVDVENLLRARIIDLWLNEGFYTNIGSGVRASQRIPRIVPLGREVLRP